MSIKCFFCYFLCLFASGLLFHLYFTLLNNWFPKYGGGYMNPKNMVERQI